jgi:hypothetical protein
MSWHPWYDTCIDSKPMTSSFLTKDFSAFCAEQDARNTLQLNVVKYVWQLCDALRHAAPDGYDYTFESGKKYHKVIMIDSSGARSVHCFVDKKTGEVYKSASWKQPAKGVRYDLRLIRDREYLFQHADWAGAYLYMK